jgi:hypothetical protein
LDLVDASFVELVRRLLKSLFFAAPAPERASDFEELSASLKRCPDTEPQLFAMCSGSSSQVRRGLMPGCKQPQGQIVIQISRLQMYLNPWHFVCAGRGFEWGLATPLAQGIATFGMGLMAPDEKFSVFSFRFSVSCGWPIRTG